jgi:hypothetical protein
MHDENPTGDAGASITERLESFLAAEEDPKEQEAPAETNVEEPESDEQSDVQEPQISTSDIAKVLGLDESLLDVDETGAAVIKTKIDGKDGAAKLADMLKSYQLQGHVDNQAREVAEQRKALQQQAEQHQNLIKQRLDELDNVVKIAGDELLREFQSIDWQTLRVSDPGEYSARMQDFQIRQQRLNDAAQQANVRRQELKAQDDQKISDLLAQERQRIPELIPEWKDASVANKERSEIMEWAQKQGADPQELGAIGRSWAVAALRKAMLYDRLQTAKADVEKKVRAAPKLVKAGQAQQVNREQQTIRTLKQNVRSSGGRETDVVQYLLASGKA